MAGFLDKTDRVVDMILTGEGKSLLSSGDLRFVYYAFFDDEIDYDPFFHASSSLSSEQMSASLQESIECTPIREAILGQMVGSRDIRNTTNGTSVLFTMPQGKTVLPRIQITPSTTSGTLEVSQRKLQDLYVKRDGSGLVIDQMGPYDQGYERFSTAVLNFQPTVQDFFDEDHQEGFLVRAYFSGSEGLVETKEKRDLSYDLSYFNNLKLVVE